MLAWLLLVTAGGALFAGESKREMIPMRDGVRLSADITLPAGDGPFPTILTRTPYPLPTGRSPYVDAGYAVVVQNLRGVFESEGKWTQFASDVHDGYDTIEWIASQPWSNGRVGVLGTSGPGIAGYMALMSGAPHLSAGAIQNAHASPYPTVTFPGGVYQSGLLDSWTQARGAEVPPAFPRPLYHRLDGEYLQRDVRTHAAGIKVPILHYTGWFDIFTQGTIDYFQQAQSHGSDKALGNQKLIIHPKGHDGRLEGDLQWETEIPAFEALARRWFDYWMKDIDTGIQQMRPIQYFVMGGLDSKDSTAKNWRTARNWPPNPTIVNYYLQPGGGLSRTAPAQSTSSSSFDYEPLNPVPSVTAHPNDWLNRPPLDQRSLDKRADILRFTTLPLSAPIEIGGRLSAELFVSTTAKDTDFFVRLIDIHPDGFEALMMSRPFRLRFREGFDRMVPAKKNKVYPITVDLWSLAMVFPKGHRLRVEITSSDVPRFDRHSNTWDPVKSYEDAVDATNTVYHSSKYQSRILLPVIKSPR